MIAEALNSVLNGMIRQAGRSYDPERGWHPLYAGRQTKAGVPMDESRALTLSAWWCAVRVLSEGLSMLPLNLRRHINERETETAYDHPLWALLHDSPNPEQNKFQWFDMQTSLQINWGDALADIQRDKRTGLAVALWPIHTSRLYNITRGPAMDSKGTVVGGKGELIYHIRNTDGTTTLIPKRDMLHVPGVMDTSGVSDGIRGIGLARAGAEALGIVEATERHVGSFYRNGASPDVVISFKNNIPKEELENLRTSWKQKHSGADNAHTMLMLSGDPDVKQLSFNARDALLMDGRKFGVAEVSRITRVPLHFLSELDRATLNNIEILGLDFLVYTLGAWIQRWEYGLRQLLTPEERKEYSFKFNVNALMRGDSNSRSQFYMRMFDMAALSINEIRELEDLNPIEGGDRYFVLANNRVPLDRIDDIALLQQGGGEDDKPSEEKAAAAVRTMLELTLSGLIQYETRVILGEENRKAAVSKPDFGAWVLAFYGGSFKGTFLKAVRPILNRAETGNPEELWDMHCRASAPPLIQLWQTMQDAPFKDFVTAVTAEVQSWPPRAAKEAAAVFSKGDDDD